MFPFFGVKLNFVMHNVCKMHWHGNWTFHGHANLLIDDSLDKTICGQDNSHTLCIGQGQGSLTHQFADKTLCRLANLQTVDDWQKDVSRTSGTICGQTV